MAAKNSDLLGLKFASGGMKDFRIVYPILNSNRVLDMVGSGGLKIEADRFICPCGVKGYCQHAKIALQSSDSDDIFEQVEKVFTSKAKPDHAMMMPVPVYPEGQCDFWSSVIMSRIDGAPAFTMHANLAGSKNLNHVELEKRVNGSTYIGLLTPGDTISVVRSSFVSWIEAIPKDFKCERKSHGYKSQQALELDVNVKSRAFQATNKFRLVTRGTCLPCTKMDELAASSLDELFDNNYEYDYNTETYNAIGKVAKVRAMRDRSGKLSFRTTTTDTDRRYRTNTSSNSDGYLGNHWISNSDEDIPF